VPLEVAFVVPVYNERGNIDPLLERLGVTLTGREWEAIFVDDGSTDETVDRVQPIARMAARLCHPRRGVQRRPQHRRRGRHLWSGHQNVWFGDLADVATGSIWNYAATRWLTWRKR